MRLASIATDYWELESGEDRHEANPESFQIPRSDREQLRIGQHVKLLFQIEGEEDDGSVGVQVERMWVLVSEVLPDGFYIGLLDNEPACLEPSPDLYLVVGAEVPFRREHVIEIGPKPSLLDRRRAARRRPTRRWRRG